MPKYTEKIPPNLTAAVYSQENLLCRDQLVTWTCIEPSNQHKPLFPSLAETSHKISLHTKYPPIRYLIFKSASCHVDF